MTGHRVKLTKHQINSHTLLNKSEFNGCIGKVRHESERVALISIERRRSGDAPLYTYRCKHCKGWHLTSRAPGTPPAHAKKLP